MSWKSFVLNDIATNIQTGPFGSQLHQSDYSKCGTPVVMPKDLLNGKISYLSIARVDKTHVDRLKKHIIQKGDIIYSRRGDVGRCAYATEQESGWLCGTGCLKLSIDTTIANSRFVYYQLQLPESIGWIVNHAVGSTMLNLNTNILAAVPIKIPTLKIQHRIADILSAYDNLIENNQKQIKLLEEMAQRLYKEWFVDLRFPGYEDTKIVDGVPEGWGKLKLSTIADLKAGGDKPDIFSKTKDGICNVPIFANGSENNGLFGYTDKAIIFNECVTISARGNVGFTCLRRKPFVPIVRLISVIPKESIVEYLFFFLNNSKFDSNGAAQQQITIPMIKNKEVLLPTLYILEKFKILITPILDKIDNLKEQNEQLSEARDRLLPKLMNGEIEV